MVERDRGDRQLIALAWYTASFSRQKRLAPLTSLINLGTRVIEGEEDKERFERQHQELIRRMREQRRREK